MSSRIATLLAWCNHHGVRIHPRVQVIESLSSNTSPDLDSDSLSDNSATLVSSCEGSIEHATTRCVLRRLLTSLDVVFRPQLRGSHRRACISSRLGACAVQFLYLTRQRGSRRKCRCLFSSYPFFSDFFSFTFIVVYIPKAAVLSVKSCSLSDVITPVPYGHGAHLALAFAVYGELLRGKETRWFGYLQSLPRELVDIALFWGVEDVIGSHSCISRGCDQNETSVQWAMNLNRSGDTRDEHLGTDADTNGPTCSSCRRLQDGKSARIWLRDTETEKELKGLLEEVRQYYSEVVEPTLHRNFGSEARTDRPDESEHKTHHNHNCRSRNPGAGPGPASDISLYGFCRAYSLVSSRAFLVDAYHGLAMVPIADAFNHTNENHVHMESEYDVCVECGSLVECEHDHEPGEHPPRPPTLGGTHPAEIVTNPPAITTKDSDADADTLEMRMVRPIPPHTEVFNTYGALTNAALLARYGFLLDANEWDVVSMPISSSLTQGFLRVAREHSNEESDKDNKSGGATGRRPPRNTTTTPGGGDWAYDTVGGKHGMLCASENRSRGDGTFIVGGGEATSRDAYEVGGDGRKAAAHFQDGDLVISLFERVARTWDCEALWDADDGDENETQALVYNPPPSTSRGKEVVLCLNSDGKLSHHLWIFCALVAFSVHLPDLVVEGNLDALKRRMLRVQEYVERAQLRGEDSESESSGASAGPDSALLSEEGGTGTSTLDVGTICLSHSHSKQATASTRPFQGTIPTALFQLLPSSEARVESNRRRLTDINIADVVVGEAEGERPVKRVRRSRSSSPPLLEDQRSSNFGLSGGGPDCTGLEYNLGEDEGFLDHRIARSLVRVVVCFCRERFEGMGAAELGEILDRTPSWMHRTRTALGIAVGEKSIVESCAATWEGLLD